MSFRENKTQALYLFSSLVFLIFVIRLLQLQVIRGSSFFEKSIAITKRSLILPAKRGRILDRKGRVLADNYPRFSVTIYPKKIKNHDDLNLTIKFIFKKNYKQVAALLKESKSSSSYRGVTVLQGLKYDDVLAIRARLSELRIKYPEISAAFDVAPQLLRKYSSSPAFGHLLGYIKDANLEEMQKLKNSAYDYLLAKEKIGKVGLEAIYDKQLRGHNGIQEILVDANNAVVDDPQLVQTNRLFKQAPKNGSDIHLSIDADLQKRAYQILSRRSSAATLVAMDPNNGELLALVSYPSYNSNRLSGSLSLKQWEYFSKSRRKILLNRSVQSAYPPGSIYKIVTAIAGLAENKIDFKTRAQCKGKLQFGDRNWSCWKHSGHGTMTIVEALIESCDVFFYELGLKLGPDKMADYARRLGLGQSTGLFSHFEASGLVPDSKWKKSRKQAFKNSDSLQLAIGQGENLMTPLQAAFFTAQVVNGGYQIKPTLILQNSKSLSDKGFLSRTRLDLGVTDEQLKEIKLALVAVVNAPRGTGSRAKITDIENVKIGGKTGTAQVIAKDKVTRAQLRDHAWFVAFAPLDKPQIVVAVLVENGGSGGKVAAPIAAEFLKYYYKGLKKNAVSSK